MEADRLLDGRLKLRHLVLITTIAERASVVRAAEHLHITQPVVTRGLRDLERILGVQLFERGPRGMQLTIYGEAVVEHARAVLAQIRQAGQHISELHAAGIGTVTVGTHVAGSNVVLPRAIARLKRQRRSVTVVVKEATPDVLTADLRTGQIDLMVGRLGPVEEDQHIKHLRLYNEPVRLFTRGGHPATRLDSLHIRDLLDYPWILPVRQTLLRQELEQVFLHEGLSMPADRVECTSISTTRTLLQETDTIAALPMLVAVGDQLTLLRVALPSVGRVVGVSVPRERAASPTTRLLLECLRAEATALRGDLEAMPEDLWEKTR